MNSRKSRSQKSQKFHAELNLMEREIAEFLAEPKGSEAEKYAAAKLAASVREYIKFMRNMHVYIHTLLVRQDARNKKNRKAGGKVA